MLRLNEVKVEYMTIPREVNFFDNLHTQISTALDCPEWLTLTTAPMLDMEYLYNHSGDKMLSPMFNHYLHNDTIYQSDFSSLVLLTWTKFKDKWARLYDVLVKTEYNPIENYNMKQKLTPDIEVVDESKTGSKTVAKGYGFNSETAVNIAESESDKTLNTYDNTRTTKGTEELERSGNIGVTTTQDMIKAELKLRENEFFSYVYEDVDSVLCGLIY